MNENVSKQAITHKALSRNIKKKKKKKKCPAEDRRLKKTTLVSI